MDHNTSDKPIYNGHLPPPVMMQATSAAIVSEKQRRACTLTHACFAAADRLYKSRLCGTLHLPTYWQITVTRHMTEKPELVNVLVHTER